MQGKELIKLAADFSAGSVTAAYIKRQYGDSVFAAVAALAAGGVAGLVTDAAIDVLDEHTGIVSAAGSVVDVGVDTVRGIWDSIF
jgi:hypothetical protein